MDKDKFNILVYSESAVFSYLMQSRSKGNNNFEVVKYIDNLGDLEKQLSINKDILVLLCASKLPAVTIIKFFEILEEKNVCCIAVCDTTRLSFSLSQKGALSTVILRENADDAEIDVFMRKLCLRIKDADRLKSVVKMRVLKKEVKVNSNKIIVFGSSTGGTEALLSVLKELPAEIPPVLVVQHMPAVFTKMYADRLNTVCKATVWEAKDGDEIKPGLVLVAPGDMQMRVIKDGSGYTVSCKKEGKVNGVEPSVDVLFDSVYENVSEDVIAVILTGMGCDGAKGMLKLKNKGALTIGQDERSCVVYGMPKVAYDIGAVKVQTSLSEIPKVILDNI